jgi:hypothetical protein
MLRQKPLALLKNVKKWVFNLFLNNDWVDKEAEHYYPKNKNESN